MVDTADGRGPLAAVAAASVGWLTVQSWIVKIGGFVTVTILARILTPSDFGLVAIAMTVLPIVYLISDLGFSTYLMQASALDRVTVSTAFWYSTASATILAGALALGAPLLESLFAVPGVAPVIVAITPAVVCVGLSAVPITLLRREMRFRVLAIQSGVAALGGQVVAVVLALNGAGVWALVAQVCVSQVISLTGAWISARWMPTFAFALGTFLRMSTFGSKVLGVNAAALARTWTESVIVSNVLGAAALGQLSIAQRLVQTSQEVAGAAISPVATVVFAQVRDDGPRLRSGYGRALALSYLAMTPALTAIIVTAPALVPLLFGPQWNASIGATQALAAAAIFTLGAVLDHGLFYGLGKPGIWLLYAIAIDAITVVTTAVVAPFGITAVAIGFLFTAVLATCVRWALVAHVLQARLWGVARNVLAALLAAVMSGTAGWLCFFALSAGLPVLRILVAGAVVLAVHLLVCRVVLPSATAEVTAQLSSRWRRWWKRRV